MISLEDRTVRAQDIDIAHRAGARLELACAEAGITARTLQRWKAHGGLRAGDRRPTALRPRPNHALTAEEREAVLRVANEPRFADMPPARIVPALADTGVYLASESSFQRVLRAHGQTRHRGRAKAPRASRPPTTHVATAPRQLWCWDMTYLPTEVLGRWFFLYLILDVFSRKIVGFEVHDTDDSVHAAHLAKRTALATDMTRSLPDRDREGSFLRHHGRPRTGGRRRLGGRPAPFPMGARGAGTIAAPDPSLRTDPWTRNEPASSTT